MDSSDGGHLSVNLQVHLSSQAWFITKQRMLRQEVHELETSLRCIARPCLNKHKQTDKQNHDLSKSRPHLLFCPHGTPKSSKPDFLSCYSFSCWCGSRRKIKKGSNAIIEGLAESLHCAVGCGGQTLTPDMSPAGRRPLEPGCHCTDRNLAALRTQLALTATQEGKGQKNLIF